MKKGLSIFERNRTIIIRYLLTKDSLTDEENKLMLTINNLRMANN